MGLKEIVSVLDKQASDLQTLGKIVEAELLDSISNSLEEVVASDEVEAKEYDAWFDKLSYDDVIEAYGYREAAKKKKFIPKDLEEGRLTKYRKPGESMEQAARRGRQSPSPSVRGMSNLYLNVFSKRKRKRKQKGKDSDA